MSDTDPSAQTPDPVALAAEVTALKPQLAARPDPAPLLAELQGLKARLAAVPDPAAAATENASLRNALEAVRVNFEALKTDNARLATEAQTVATAANATQVTLAQAIRDRDAALQQFKALEPKALLADELTVKVNGFINEKRESALVDALRAKFPGADTLALQGVLTKLHDTGRVNKFAEDTAATLAAALPIITAEAPSLTRPPTAGGGSAGLRGSATPVRRHSIIG